MTDVPDRAELISAARAEIAAMGPTFDLKVLQRTAAAYLPLLRQQPLGGVHIEQDVAYGPHERHRFDLFLPAAAVSAPMMIFIHGGGFVGGDKVVNEDIYRNLGLYFARQGVITLIANYRLAPHSVWPAGSEDIGALVRWARGNAARLGGDSDAVFLFGQSAGAVHVMGYLFSPELWDGEVSGVAGGIGMSGVYRAFGEGVGRGGLVYFGEDEDRRRADCPLSRASANRTPLLIGVMEYDPAHMAVHSFELAAELTRVSNRAPRFAYYAGHNHASTVYGIGSGQDEVGEDIMRFIRDVRGAA
jgi:triacylglycerol lipase